MLKYKIYVFLFFILFIVGINVIVAKKNKFELLGKVIYLDPGHGGKDSGAVYKNIYEKNINLEICKKLEEKLISKGATVYLTRYDDYDLSIPNVGNHKRSDLNIRGKMINNSNSDLFISIHLNAESSGIWSGPQVFYNSRNMNNKNIAKIMQNVLNKGLKSDRKYKENNKLYLQKKIDIPGVLIEVGFLSNSNDRYLLKNNNYQEKVVDTIYTGIKYYFNKR